MMQLRRSFLALVLVAFALAGCNAFRSKEIKPVECDANVARAFARSTFPPETVFRAMTQALDSLKTREITIYDSTMDVHFTINRRGFRALVEGKVRPDGEGGSVAAAVMRYSSARNYANFETSLLYQTEKILDGDDNAYRVLPLASFQRTEEGCDGMDSIKSEQRALGDAFPFPTIPEPVGGFAAFGDALYYPDWARAAGVEGRVVVEFFISEAGTVECARVLSGPLLLTDAALRKVVETPWKPGKLDGKPVDAVVAIPLMFRLRRHP